MQTMPSPPMIFDQIALILDAAAWALSLVLPLLFPLPF
jgi:hypothetical protein